jgi:hypothetical protein
MSELLGANDDGTRRNSTDIVGSPNMDSHDEGP